MELQYQSHRPRHNTYNLNCLDNGDAEVTCHLRPDYHAMLENLQITYLFLTVQTTLTKHMLDVLHVLYLYMVYASEDLVAYNSVEYIY